MHINRKRVVKTSIVILITLVMGFYLGRFSVNGFKSQDDLSNYSEIIAFGKIEEDKISEAIHYLTLSKHYNPDNMGPYLGLGTIFYDFRLFDLALEELEEAVKRDFTNRLFYGEKIKQLSKYSKALAYCYLGDIYDKLANKEMSLNSYKSSIKVYHELPEYLMGKMKTRMRKDKISQKEYEQSLLFISCLKGLSNANVLKIGISEQINKVVDEFFTGEE